jgi:hypothetical protein
MKQNVAVYLRTVHDQFVARTDMLKNLHYSCIKQHCYPVSVTGELYRVLSNFSHLLTKHTLLLDHQQRTLL